jgi:hypothetical protein
MMFINVLVFIVFIAIGAIGLGKLSGLGDAGVGAMDAASKGIVGLFALLVAVFMLVSIFFGCFVNCCYKTCCCCMALWVPLTFILAIMCAAIGAVLGGFRNNISDTLCDAAAADIKSFWDEYVDGVMCSTACPCDADQLTLGGYSLMTSSELGAYGDPARSPITDVSGANPLMTSANLPAPGAYPAEVQAVMTELGISAPATVTTYQECFNTMLSASGYTSDMSAAEQQNFEEFTSEVF